MKRRLYAGSALKRVQTIEELRAMAHRRLPAFAWEYIESGSEDEVSLKRNRDVFDDISFRPSTLVDVTQTDSSATLFGSHLPIPLVIAPTGFNGLAYPGGDSALARAARRAGVPFTLSSFANESIEEIGAVHSAMNWFQLYIFGDPKIMLRLLERARDADFKALVVTTDANVASSREWQTRCYRSPGKLTLQHLIDASMHLRWLRDFLTRSCSHGSPIFANLAEVYPRRDLFATKAASLITSQLQSNINWQDIRKLRDAWDRPLLIKGVMSERDALLASEVGADGIVVTNHGGRQLDGALSPMEVLPSIRRCVPNMSIIVDSGFRRGSDVLKAVALGADAVMVGRATLYGLAAAGEEGVWHALEILRKEIQRTLRLLGCTKISETADHIHLRRFQLEGR
jgi:(S)-mandelate dehydrogenase